MRVGTEPSYSGRQQKKQEAHISSNKQISIEEACWVGTEPGIDWTKIGLEQF